MTTPKVSPAAGIKLPVAVRVLKSCTLSTAPVHSVDSKPKSRGSKDDLAITKVSVDVDGSEA